VLQECGAPGAERRAPRAPRPAPSGRPIARRQEFCEECDGQHRTVVRPAAPGADAALPARLRRAAGDRILAGLVHGFRGEQFGAPPPLPGSAPLADLAAGVQSLLRIFASHGAAPGAPVPCSPVCSRPCAPAHAAACGRARGHREPSSRPCLNTCRMRCRAGTAMASSANAPYAVQRGMPLALFPSRVCTAGIALQRREGAGGDEARARRAGYALDARVSDVAPARSCASVERHGACPSAGSFSVRLEGPATLWGALRGPPPRASCVLHPCMSPVGQWPSGIFLRRQSLPWL